MSLLVPSVFLHPQFNVASSTSSFALSSVQCRFWYQQFRSNILGLTIHHRSPSRLKSTFCVNSTISSMSLLPAVSLQLFSVFPYTISLNPVSTPLSMSLLPSLSLQLPRSSYPPSVSIPFQLKFQCRFHHQFNVAFTIRFAPPSVQYRFYHQFRSNFLYHQFRSNFPRSSHSTPSVSIPSQIKLLCQFYHQSRSNHQFLCNFRWSSHTPSVSTLSLNFTFNVASTITFAPTSSVLTSTIGLNPVSTEIPRSIPSSVQCRFYHQFRFIASIIIPMDAASYPKPALCQLLLLLLRPYCRSPVSLYSPITLRFPSSHYSTITDSSRSGRLITERQRTLTPHRAARATTDSCGRTIPTESPSSGRRPPIYPGSPSPGRTVPTESQSPGRRPPIYPDPPSPGRRPLQPNPDSPSPERMAPTDSPSPGTRPSSESPSPRRTSQINLPPVIGLTSLAPILLSETLSTILAEPSPPTEPPLFRFEWDDDAQLHNGRLVTSHNWDLAAIIRLHDPFCAVTPGSVFPQSKLLASLLDSHPLWRLRLHCMMVSPPCR